MTPEDKVERFKPFAELLRKEGKSDQEIERAFRNYLDCEKMNAQDRIRKSSDFHRIPVDPMKLMK
jgi:hypothetical protein